MSFCPRMLHGGLPKLSTWLAASAALDASASRLIAPLSSALETVSPPAHQRLRTFDRTAVRRRWPSVLAANQRGDAFKVDRQGCVEALTRRCVAGQVRNAVTSDADRWMPVL